MAEANAATATTTAAFIRTFCLCLFVWSQRCNDIDIHPHTNAHFASVSSCGHRGATTSTFIRIQTHILRLSLRVVTEVQRHLHSSAFKRTFCICLFLWTEEQRQLHSFICTQTHILRLFLWIEEEQLSYIHPHTQGHEGESISLFFALMITFF
ncbi:unnamed protein product [Sphagnum jensenii]|uniref:Secreted protein n=1 Tax=Sphagnum jensenii TaxID=128206 RepID=A0ABP1AGM7_9BRYO